MRLKRMKFRLKERKERERGRFKLKIYFTGFFLSYIQNGPHFFASRIFAFNVLNHSTFFILLLIDLQSRPWSILISVKGEGAIYIVHSFCNTAYVQVTNYVHWGRRIPCLLKYTTRAHLVLYRSTNIRERQQKKLCLK